MTGNWIDITRPIELGALVHPEDPPPQFERYSDIARGDDYNLTKLTISLHTGTHFDAPHHFVESGKAIDQLQPEMFVTRAIVVELGDANRCKAGDLEGHGITRGDAVLLRTSNERLPRDRMAERWVYVTPEAAQWCVVRGVTMLGVDYIEVESPDEPHGSYPVHRTLLSAGVLLLENLDLRQVDGGEYQLLCLPLKITGAEAAPCRALLRRLDD
jgi:arylformamidase